MDTLKTKRGYIENWTWILKTKHGYIKNQSWIRLKLNME